MILQVHEDRPFQSELAVLHHDCFPVLGDAVDGAIESPVEDDAGGFTAEAGIIFASELCSGLLSGFGQLCASVEAWACRSTAPSRAAACIPAPATFTRGLGNLAQWNQAT